jgi:hypothetical protein
VVLFLALVYDLVEFFMHLFNPLGASCQIILQVTFVLLAVIHKSSHFSPFAVCVL